MNIELKELNNDNWLETANLSVSEKQKEIFPILELLKKWTNGRTQTLKFTQCNPLHKICGGCI